jgi:hypothetical protein
MLSGGAAGHLFYLERYFPGGAMFLLTALFLFYAMIASPGAGNDEKEVPYALTELQTTLGQLALLVAENTLNGAKSIGRTLPCTQQELSRMEDSLTALLDALPVDSGGKQGVAQEFEKLRERSRQNEGRRILTNRRF